MVRQPLVIVALVVLLLAAQAVYAMHGPEHSGFAQADCLVCLGSSTSTAVPLDTRIAPVTPAGGLLHIDSDPVAAPLYGVLRSYQERAPPLLS